MVNKKKKKKLVSKKKKKKKKQIDCFLVILNYCLKSEKVKKKKI